MDNTTKTVMSGECMSDPYTPYYVLSSIATLAAALVLTLVPRLISAPFRKGPER